MHQHFRYDAVWGRADYAVPSSWHLLTGGNTTTIQSMQLKMPNARSGPIASLSCTDTKLACDVLNTSASKQWVKNCMAYMWP